MIALWKRTAPAAPPLKPIEGISLAEPYYRVGDKVGSTRGSLIIQNRVHFAVAEGGIVTWAGNSTEFSQLIRNAARNAP